MGYRVVSSTSAAMEETLNREWEGGWKLHSFQHSVLTVSPITPPIFILVLERRAMEEPDDGIEDAPAWR